MENELKVSDLKIGDYLRVKIFEVKDDEFNIIPNNISLCIENIEDTEILNDGEILPVYKLSFHTKQTLTVSKNHGSFHHYFYYDEKIMKRKRITNYYE